MPQERKRHIKMKGEQLFKSLKVVTDAHQENIHEIISNLASEGNLSYLNIVLRAMDVMFSRLEAKTALTFTLSDKSHSMLFESLCMPDWTYILLKVRTKISDSA
jgi:pyrroloquinoline quinone (PQQ) biosynthesis protein C